MTSFGASLLILFKVSATFNTVSCFLFLDICLPLAYATLFPLGSSHLSRCSFRVCLCGSFPYPCSFSLGVSQGFILTLSSSPSILYPKCLIASSMLKPLVNISPLWIYLLYLHLASHSPSLTSHFGWFTAITS